MNFNVFINIFCFLEFEMKENIVREVEVFL